MRRLSLNGKIIGKTRKFSKDRRTSPLLTNLFRLTDYELIIVWKQHRLPRCRSPPLLKFDPMPYQISEESEENILHKRYFRKKDPHRKAGETEWIEMTGKEYYCFVRVLENRGRWFIDMGNVVLECTKDEYRKYKAEDDHSSYILKQENDWSTYSLESIAGETDLSSERLLVDLTQDVERDALYSLMKQELYAAIQKLPASDYWVISELFLSETRKTVRQLSAESGIPVMTLQNRKSRILRSLKKYFQG